MNKRRREDTARLEASKSQVQLCDNGNGEVTVNHTQGMKQIKKIKIME